MPLRSILQRILPLLALLFVSSMCLSQQTDNAAQEKIKRLQTPVTVVSPRLYLYELLAQLSAQTGVALHVDAKDKISGIPLSVCLQNVPLKDAMDSLKSLLSFRDAPLLWLPTSEAKTPRYQLASTRGHRELAERLNREMQKAFDEQADLMIKMCYMTPEERKRNLKKLASAMLEDDTKIATTYIEDSPAANQNWEGIRLFADTLNAEQRKRIFNGEQLDIPIAQLSREGQNFVKSNTQKTISTVTTGGKTELVESPEPTILRFHMHRGTGKYKQINFQLMIGIGVDSEVTSLSYLGLFGIGLRRRCYSNWILPGDTKTHLIGKQEIKPTAKDIAHVEGTPRLTHQLMQCAVATPVSYLAVLPEAETFFVSAPFGKTVEQFLDSANKDTGSLMFKWRNDMLLVNHHTWFYGDDAQFPYQVLQKLRASSAKSGSYMSAEDLANAVVTLNSSQLERLSEEFPVFADALAWSPLQLIPAYPNILSAQGVPVTPAILSFLMQQVGIQGSPVAEPLSAIRLNIQKAEVGNKSLRLLVLESRTKNHNWFVLSAMEIKPTNPKSKPISNMKRKELR